MDLLYLIARQLAAPASPDDCAPLEFPGRVATLEHWRLVPTTDGPYLLEGVLAGRAITSVVIAVYARTLARIAERWIVLGRPLNGHLPEFDDADVIRRAAHWIVKMHAKEQAECARFASPSFETAASPPPQDEG
jgi:hypothetical protein